MSFQRSQIAGDPTATLGRAIPRLGERLVAQKLISQQQISQALEVQKRTGGFLGQILVDLGFVESQKVASFLANEFGVPYVDLLAEAPDPNIVKLVRENDVRQLRAIPIRITDGFLEVAMVDPLDTNAIDALHQLTGYRILPVLTMAWELERTINEIYDATSRATAALKQLGGGGSVEGAVEPDRQDRARNQASAEAQVVVLVNSLIEGAIAVRASDIHFEPRETMLRVRYRVDGRLMDQTDIPRALQSPVLARLKALATMDVTESRQPQDGRIDYDHHGKLLDLRVSSIPTVFGEKMVLRVLDKASVMVPLSRLGFLSDQQERFEYLISQPHGMIIVAGPTGSGKSTTLYASLNRLNDGTRNILTLEDPVEYRVPGLNQVQVNHNIGLTFAAGLRTLVRQDPDVILVGEIRDPETAEMAVQASLTGHLMLTTLHTNSAVGTVSRLTNLKVHPFLISQALSGVVSQRLLARVCASCSENYHPDPHLLRAIGIGPDEERTIEFRRGRGCRVCYGRGFLGRIGVFQVLVVNEEMRRLILRDATEDELEQAAERAGMRSMQSSALQAVRAGLTTPEEVGRAVRFQQ
jgi:type IV pilus assembly protein PilB